MNISKQSELLEMYNTTLRRGSNPIIVMNVKTSNLKPVPKIYRHTHDENMSLVTVSCKSAVNKTVAISVVRHSMSSTNVTYTFKKTCNGALVERQTLMIIRNLVENQLT